MSANLDAAGEALARARVRRDSLSPREAARAAGAKTEAEIDRLAAKIADQRRGVA